MNNLNLAHNDKKEQNQRGDSALAAKAGFWYVCGVFVGKAITFITTPVFARLMTNSDYGEFSNFASWVSILIIFVGAELYNTLSRAYYDFKENYDEYISTVTILGSVFTGITYVLFLLFREPVLKIVSIPEQYVHLMFFFLLFSFCRLVYYARERTLYRYKSVAVITILSLCVPTLISVFLVFFLPEVHHLSARLYGYYLPSALIGLFCAASLFRKTVSFKWQYCRYALVLSVPLLVHYLTSHLLTTTNIMITKDIIGAEAAAVVSIAHSATHILSVFFQATSGALTTWLMDNLELGNKEKIRKGTLLYVVLIAALILAVVLFTPEVILLLGGKKYVESVSLLPGLAYASFVHSVLTIFTIILTYDKNVVKTAAYTSIFALISVAAKIWLLPVYGLLVLVNINIAVFGILVVINYFLIKRAGYADIISVKGLVMVILITGFLVLLHPLLYKWQALRYSVMAVFVTGCFVITALHRKQLSDFLKRIRNKKF